VVLIAPASTKNGFLSQSGQRNNRNVKKVSPKGPQPGAPALALPNLETARHARSVDPKAPREIESNIRSRRKPLESRQGRKVGDPLPPKKKAGLDNLADGGERVRIASANNRRSVGAARTNHARTARSLPAEAESFSSLLSLLSPNRRLLNHVGLSFLRYQALRSDTRAASTLGYFGSGGIDSHVFDLFLSPMPQSGSSKIVFASNREGSMQIYVMNGDGSAVTRLTSSGANDDYPRWSPNGAKILFQSDRDHPDTGYMDIYVMNSDGSGVARLTTDANDDSMPSWSGDGTKIVFQSMRNGVNYQVYSMNADGSNQVCLTNTSSSDGEPSWSADGTKITFASDRDHSGYDSIYVMNGNGSGQQRLTFSADTVDDTQPAWSRDGSKIAFVSTRDSVLETWQETDDDGNYITKSKLHINKEVYVMNADGSGQLRLTNNLSNDDAPAWSPDGSKIVFRSDRDRDCCDPSAQVWTMNADGSGQSDVSNDGTGNYTASWTSGSGNLPPIANAGGTYSGILSQNVPFHGASSYDPDGTVVSYSWNFGDGGTASGPSPTHAYTTVGTYTATLTVTDNLGSQGSASTTVSISSSSSDQYSVNFLQMGLGRAPYSNEGNYWTDIMRAAYLQGQPSMLMAMTEFGMTVFESAEYVGRNRSDHDFVYDLYKTYLMREPDQDGWDYWTTQASPLHMGRIQVRNAFEGSGEFHNIVATLAASGNPSTSAASLSTARVDPFNQSGNQVQARDCEFGIPLLSLPGRAGLDLGLRVSYSSLVWTQSGPYVYFNPDNEGMSPGFTIGFPSIQGRVFDAQTGRNIYLLIAGGHRIELRQSGTSNVYESYDSSYLQLVDYGSGLTLKTTDGTQIGYGSFANGWQATAIEDRNGNVLTINNYWWGEIANITDTLGRVLNFNYDGNSNLTSITQSWSGQSQPHTWVTFGWGSATLHPSFGSEVVGTFDGENIPVLTMVGLADGSYDKFAYNGYGQVSQLTHYASDSNPLSDNHPLNTTAYDYGPAGFDCPRLSEQRVSAENWTSVNGLPANALTQFSDPGDGSRQMITADNTIYKEFFGTGWQHGLVTSTQVIAASTVQKSTTTSYEQNDTSVNYQTNPRVTVSDISDDTNHNHKHTAIGYDTFSLPSGTSCSLPNDVYEYDVDGTVLRRTHTDYNHDSNYLSRHIIGLPQARLLYQGVSALMSKTTYVYDWGGEFLQGLPAAPTQHDSSYSTDFVRGRANLVDVVRWDVNDPDNSSKALETKIAYDIDGSITFTRDPLNHQTSASYSESFSDGNNSRNTFAYPTVAIDPDGGHLYIQYNFNFGRKTRFEGPPPQNQPNGIVQTFDYDDSIRIRQVTTANTGSYSRYVYGPTNVVTLSSVNFVGDEAYTNNTFDGLGRALGIATNNPGSSGGYKAQLTQYDIMGRAIMQSNPTEIDGAWNPSGDDSAGYIYTQQTYDWKGRPLETRHLIDGAVKYASYGGCGCAGGEIATLTDEVGRQERLYSDALGRQWKTEIVSDGNVYSATVNVYNARDQITDVKQFSGSASADASSTNTTASCPTGTCQGSSAVFDGYGRLKTKHAVEQDAGSFTAFTYNNDDTLNSVTDARGASASYVYNNYRGLINQINYYSPSGVVSTSGVSFGYDAAGNRTLMTDGLGATSYNYDSLSRMTSETRTFDGVGSYTLSYGYNYAGELTRITDPTNSTINYTFDNIGRLSNVFGSDNLYGGVSNYASGFAYRATGGIKNLTYGNNLTLSVLYNGRTEPTQYQIGGRNPSYGPPTAAQTTFSYFADGRIQYAHDSVDDRFDRAFVNDQLGTVKEAYSGSEARDFVNNTNSGTSTGPYRQSYQHDPFGNITRRDNRFWSATDTLLASFSNNRRADSNYHYDADGNLTSDPDVSYGYDAAGNNVSLNNTVGGMGYSTGFDADGQMIKKAQTQSSTTTQITYYLHSTVLGGRVVTEIGGMGQSLGQKQKGYVFAGSEVLATHENNNVLWQHDNPITASQGYSTIQGVYIPKAEYDPIGIDVGFDDPYQNLLVDPTPPENRPGLLVGFSIPDGRCQLDGMAIDCGWAMQLLDSGAAVQCPNNDCGPRVMNSYNANGQFLGTVLSQPFQAFADGYSGFLPPGATYQGNGSWIIPSSRPSTPPSLKPAAPAPGGVSAGNRNPYGGIGTDEGPTGDVTGQLGATPQYVPISQEDIKAFAQRVEKMVTEQKCKDFLNQLLAEVAKETNAKAKTTADILPTFNKTHFYWEKADGMHGGHQFQENGSPAASISDEIKHEKFISNDRSAFLIKETSKAFLGETLHNLSYNDDAVFSRALNAIRANQGIEAPREFPDKTNMDVENASRYWHPKVDAICPGPRQ
jgi:YD repeat-containing protein